MFEDPGRVRSARGPFARVRATVRAVDRDISLRFVTMSTSGRSRQPSLGFSDSGDEKHVDTNGGDYSTRMSELFDDDDDDTPTVSVPHFDADDDGEDEDEEAFVYDGADAQVTRSTYREQLRQVLDDDDEDEDGAEEHEVERSLLHDAFQPPITVEDEALVSQLSNTLVQRLSRVAHLPSAHRPFHAAPGHLYTLAFLRIGISFLPTSHVFLLTERGPVLFTSETIPPPDDLTSALVHTPRFAHLLRNERALCFSRRVTRPVQLFYALAWLVFCPPPGRREARFPTSEWSRPRCARGIPVDATTCARDTRLCATFK